ncbi:hypothetical protein [Pseudoalteromonas luteoviolacea]|uniref:hypothetical protein n=1 Tax=Pseudoalteromonas luteoviolacea TaxID=43657 RepID=UPI001B364490|nr:hypothetical protein [Pseudoalteromonas luteoviolacea]MBQ4840052.1 hypothetical protein [Pseudoalteromonas luteoviolacea]
MDNKISREYQKNLPFIDDVNLMQAAKVAIYVIVEKSGRKSDSIRNVARKYSVRESELLECINEAIPKHFFAERAARARKRKAATFYKAPEARMIPESEKAVGKEHLRNIKAMFRKE